MKINICVAQLIFCLLSVVAQGKPIEFSLDKYISLKSPVYIKYDGKIGGVYPQNSDDSKIPTKLIGQFAIGENGAQISKIRKFNKKLMLLDEYSFGIKDGTIISFNKSRDIVEVFKQGKQRMPPIPSFLDLLTGFPLDVSSKRQIIAIAELLNNQATCNFKLLKNSTNNSVVLTFKTPPRPTENPDFKVVDVYALEMNMTNGKYYPSRASSSYILVNKNGNEYELPAVADICYKNYKLLPKSQIEIPWVVELNRYSLSPVLKNDDVITNCIQNKIYWEILNVMEISEDPDIASSNASIEVPSSARVFNSITKNAYDLSDTIKKIKNDMNSK